jgi:hypothetical protein
MEDGCRRPFCRCTHRICTERSRSRVSPIVPPSLTHLFVPHVTERIHPIPQRKDHRESDLSAMRWRDLFGHS